MKKLVALLLVAMMLCASMAALAESPEGYPEVVEGIDFGGKTIYIYDYWTGDPSRKENPNEEEQAQYDYRDWIMSTYNCEVVQIQKGDWGSNADELVNFFSAPDGTLCLFILPGDFVGGPMANNAFANWGDNELIDLTAEKWNKGAVDFMTAGSNIFGVASDAPEPRQCLFFNKRVLEEANIDWNEIYDMQEAGTWTWDVFEGMLQQLTRDTDGDGVTDIWGMTGNNSDLFMISVFSNGGTFFDFNENGDLAITVGSDAALEGLTWAKDIWSKYAFQQPEDGAWDYYKDAFRYGGNIGFDMGQTYEGFNDNADLSVMEDEWGCVAFPTGPKGSGYVTITSNNITVVPAVYDAETTRNLEYIYDLWTNATPGYDDEESWIGNKFNFTDERAVLETYAMLRESGAFNKVVYLGSVNDILGNSLLWQIMNDTPAALVEAATPAWQELCNTFNGK